MAETKEQAGVWNAWGQFIPAKTKQVVTKIDVKATGGNEFTILEHLVSTTLTYKEDGTLDMLNRLRSLLGDVQEEGGKAKITIDFKGHTEDRCGR